MALELTTPPASEPVTLDELKAWARVDSTDDDDLLTANGVAAREHVERWLGRQLVTATWTLTMRDFPSGLIRLPRPPLQSISSIKWKDTDGTLSTMDAGDYLVDTAADPGTVEPATSWPKPGDFPDAIQIAFVAGFGDPADVPENIKIAIKALAAHWYEAREPAVVGASVANVPSHVSALVNGAKLWSVA